MKWSKYNCILKQDNKTILFNFNSSMLLLLDKKKDIELFERLSSQSDINLRTNLAKKLRDRKMIVQSNEDEYNEVKNRIEDYYDNAKKKLDICIYTTMNCNFRCVYCMEKHTNQRFSSKKWESLYKYIENKVKNEGVEFLIIDFFGGEPLLETKAIIKFLEKLQELKQAHQDLKIMGTTFTNGYLLTPEVYDKLVCLDLKMFTITLDGFAETHNKTRPRIDGEGTWDKIIENLNYINRKYDNAVINVRYNLSKENESTMIDFYNWFSKEFRNRKFLYDFCEIVKFSDKVKDNLVYKDRDKISKFTESMNKNKKYVTEISNLMFLGFACKYAEQNSIGITVDGDVLHCMKDFGDAKPVGYLNDSGEIIFNETYESWITGFETEQCKDCQIFPLCGGRKCPEKKFLQDKGCRLDCMTARQHANEILFPAINAFAERYEAQMCYFKKPFQNISFK